MEGFLEQWQVSLEQWRLTLELYICIRHSCVYGSIAVYAGESTCTCAMYVCIVQLYIRTCMNNVGTDVHMYDVSTCAYVRSMDVCTTKWVAKIGRWVAKLGRWVAKLVRWRLR